MSKNLYFKITYDVLYDIYANRSYSSIKLNNALKSVKDERDKAIVTKIVYGVLEKDIQIKHILSALIKNSPQLSTEIILKIGVYCILNLNSIPSYAVVNELVNLTKTTRCPYNSGLVNKVLKKIDKAEYNIDLGKDYIKNLSYEYSCPEWAIKQIHEDYGNDFLIRFLKNKKTNLIHIRLDIKEISKNDFKKLLEDNDISYKESVYDDSLFVDYVKIRKIKSFDKKYFVQSLGSMSVVRHMNSIQNEMVLDCCAAPGGKSMYIASKIFPQDVYSSDIHDHRVNLIKKYANFYGIKNIKVFKCDMTSFEPKLKEKFDKILCDVPCTGSGVVSKKPDVLLFKNENDIKELNGIQINILETVKEYLKPGGEIIYSTCSVFKKENSDIVDCFLKNNPEFMISKIEEEKIRNINEKGAVLLDVDDVNREYYYIAKLTKR